MKTQQLVAGSFCFFSYKALHAALWTMLALTPTQFQIEDEHRFKVRYAVRNQSNHAKRLAIVPMPGVKQLNKCFLGPQTDNNSTCILELSISGKEVPENGLKGGPVLCEITIGETLNKDKCKGPLPVQQLQLKKRASLSILPDYMALKANEISQKFVVKNTSYSKPIKNIRLSTSNGLSFATNTCPKQLEPRRSCSFTLFTYIEGHHSVIINSEASDKQIAIANATWPPEK